MKASRRRLLKKPLALSPLSLAIAACGGGGGGQSNNTNTSNPDLTDDVFADIGTDGLDEKVSLSSLVSNDGSSSVKVGIATSERGDHGTVSILSVYEESIINIDAFSSDERFSGIDGSGFTIAVLDTGMDLDNEAFGADTNNDGIADRIIFARDFTSEGDGTADDVQGHGTHVASIIGSSSSDTIGIAPGVNFVALQVLDSTGVGTERDIEDALQWVIQHAEAMNIVAVNLSLGDTTNYNVSNSHPVYGDELLVLHDHLNVAVVAAAGNEYQVYQSEGASSLAADPNVIAIGAVGGTPETADDLAFFSQRSVEIPTFLHLAKL